MIIDLDYERVGRHAEKHNAWENWGIVEKGGTDMYLCLSSSDFIRAQQSYGWEGALKACAHVGDRYDGTVDEPFRKYILAVYRMVVTAPKMFDALNACLASAAARGDQAQVDAITAVLTEAVRCEPDVVTD